MKRSDRAPRLGIVISMFPELHETFILRELVALEQRGIDFDIFSLQYPRDAITLDDARRLATRTHYAPLFGWAAVVATFRTVLRRPLTLVRTLATVVIEGRDRPRELIRNLAVLPRALQIGELGRRRGIRHWHGHWANVPTTVCWYLQQLGDANWSAAIHGEDIFTPNRMLTRKLDDAAFTVVCSAHFARHLRERIRLRPPARVHVNYHGLDPQVWRRAVVSNQPGALSDGALRLISIGRLVPTKGHDVLLRACARLRDQGHELIIELIGSGPLDTELRELAVAEGLADSVHFHGALGFTEVLEHLESADLFCLAPRLLAGQPPDGIPNVLAEAMALGVPVVSTHISAIPELVQHEVTGLLVMPDDPDALATAIRRLASDARLREQLASNARLRVAKQFDQMRNIDELLGYFERYVPGKVVVR